MAAASAAIRITDRATAEAHIGRVCTYNTADGVEYGRIKRVTPTQVILDRLQQTATGTFLPHPVPVCPSSRNSVGYTRDIRLVSAPDIPTAADYRLNPADIRADRCQARRVFDGEHGKDRRWSPVVYREFQCDRVPSTDSDLCVHCRRNEERHDTDGQRKNGRWHGRVTEPLMPWAHMLGTEWATLPAGAVWRGGPAPAWWPVAAAAAVAPPVLLFNVPEDAAEPEPAPAVAAAAPAVLTEDACARIFWTNEWRIGADDCLMELPQKSIQIFWRWLKNLTYNDGSVSKLNTHGADSRAEIIAQLRLWYPEMRARGVRGFDRKEVAVPPLPVAATINVPEDAAEPEPAPRFNVPEDAAPEPAAAAATINVPEDAAEPAPRFNVPEDAAEPEPAAAAATINVPEDAAPTDAQRIAALEAENARERARNAILEERNAILEERNAAALALIHTLTATV